MMDLKKILALLIISGLGVAFYHSWQKGVIKNIRTVKTNYWGSSKLNSVNLYTTASAGSAIIALLNKPGVPLFVFNCEKSWCYIELLNGAKGFVKQNDISKQATAVVKEKIDVITLPGSKKALATLYPNVIVKLMHRNGKWCCIEKNNIRGYVPTSVLLGGFIQDK